MCDVMDKRGITLDIISLEKELKTKIFLISTRNSTGIEDLLNEIPKILDTDTSTLLDNSYMDLKTLQKVNKKKHALGVKSEKIQNDLNSLPEASWK